MTLYPDRNFSVNIWWKNVIKRENRTREHNHHNRVTEPSYKAE